MLEFVDLVHQALIFGGGKQLDAMMYGRNEGAEEGEWMAAGYEGKSESRMWKFVWV
jgi:hypothetical protein